MLFNCPECKGHISQYAEFCPHCGLPKSKLRPHLEKAVKDYEELQKSLQLERVEQEKKHRKMVDMTKSLMKFDGPSPLSVMPELSPYREEASEELRKEWEEKEVKRKKQEKEIVLKTLRKAKQMQQEKQPFEAIKSYLNQQKYDILICKHVTAIFRDDDEAVRPIQNFMLEEGYIKPPKKETFKDKLLSKLIDYSGYIMLIIVWVIFYFVIT